MLYFCTIKHTTNWKSILYPNIIFDYGLQKDDEGITARLFNEIGRQVTRQVWNSNLLLSLKMWKERFASYSLHLVAIGEQRLR